MEEFALFLRCPADFCYSESPRIEHIFGVSCVWNELAPEVTLKAEDMVVKLRGYALERVIFIYMAKRLHMAHRLRLLPYEVLVIIQIYITVRRHYHVVTLRRGLDSSRGASP